MEVNGKKLCGNDGRLFKEDVMKKYIIYRHGLSSQEDDIRFNKYGRN